MFAVGMDEFCNLILYSQVILSPYKKINAAKQQGCVAATKTKNKGTCSTAASQEPSISSAKRDVKEIIFGSLLGDAHLELPPRGLNARFGFTQSLEKKDYFLSVLNSLEKEKICSGKYRENSHADRRTGKIYTNLNFWSKALPLLNEFYIKFYNNKVKIVPLDLSLLTPIALAHFVMQDGSRGTSNGLYLCTDCFTYNDVQRLSLYLNNIYNIKCSIHKSGKNYRIYILVKSVETVKLLILPFMHETMRYKLGV